MSPDTTDFKYKTELRTVLSERSIRPSEVCLVGSLSMSIRGLRTHNDIDVVLHPAVRATVVDTDGSAKLSDNIEVVAEGWGDAVGIGDEKLVEDERYSDEVGEFRVVRPELYFSREVSLGNARSDSDIELLESYALESDDWDWDFVTVPNRYADEGTTPLLQRGYRSLRRDGMYETATSALGLLSQTGVARRMGRVLEEGVFVREETQRADAYRIPQLLARQHRQGMFTRYDFICYWLRLQESDSSCPDDIPVVPEGGNTDVTLTVAGELVSGISTLCEAIKENRSSVPVQYVDASAPIRDPEWLAEQGLTRDQIRALVNAKHEFFRELGVYFYTFLWPPANDVFDDIESDIRSEYRVVDTWDVMPDDLSGFIRDVYRTDDIDRWKIEKKIHEMSDFPPVVRIVEFNIPNASFRKKTSAEGEISTDVEQLKRRIRTTYMDEIEDYVYDIIVHVTDDYRQNTDVSRTLNNYLGESSDFRGTELIGPKE